MANVSATSANFRFGFHLWNCDRQTIVSVRKKAARFALHTQGKL